MMNDIKHDLMQVIHKYASSKERTDIAVVSILLVVYAAVLADKAIDLLGAVAKIRVDTMGQEDE